MGRDLWISLVKPPCPKHSQEQLSQVLKSVSFPWNCKIYSPVLWASPLQVTFVDAYHPHISGKSTPVSGWLNSTLANCWQKAWQIPSYLQLPLSFWRKTAEILFYLSLLAAVFQRECQEFIGRNSVYVWISFPWLVCQYPRLLIFWTGCVAHLFSQALSRRHNGEHI